MKPTAEVVRKPDYPNHWFGVVTTSRGLCYYCMWADDGVSPATKATVLKAWREDRKSFQPYPS